jgi:hypothetical protein
VTLLGVAGSYTLSGPDKPVVLEASEQGSTTITITPSDGFTGPVNMACSASAAASGHTPVCQAAAATVYGSVGASSVVTVATYGDTPAGNYTITVTGTSGGQSKSAEIPLQVTDGPGFALSASDGSLSIAAAGQSATDTLSIAPVKGFSGTLALNCIVAPTPASGKAPECTLPANVALGADTVKVTLKIATEDATVPGSYTVAIAAAAGDQQRTLALPLTLQQPSASPTFEVSAASSTVSIAAAGQSVTDMLTIKPASGFTGTVQLSCTVSGSASTTATPTCAIPASASITGALVANATLTINTVSPSAARVGGGRLFGEGVGGLMLGCLLIFAAPRRRMWTSLGMLVLAVVFVAVTGCGGGHHDTGTGGTPGTPAGTYAVTVNAVSGTITASTKVTVTVQ